MAKLPEVQLSNTEPLVRNPALQLCLDDKTSEYFKTYSIMLEDGATDRLANALAQAVSKLTNRLNNVRITYLLFGVPPAYVFPVQAGHSIYVPDMSLSPIATTWGPCIYLDAPRLARLETEPVDLAAVNILHEFTHSLFGIADEAMAISLTCDLFGGIEINGSNYQMMDDRKSRRV